MTITVTASKGSDPFALWLATSQANHTADVIVELPPPLNLAQDTPVHSLTEISLVGLQYVLLQHFEGVSP